MNLRPTSPASAIALALAIAIALQSCGEPPVVNQPQARDPYKEHMINANRVIDQAEQEQIQAYIARRQWSMQQLSNGSWLEETQQGRGAKIEWDDTVAVSYSLEGLDGRTIYDTVQQTVIVGQNHPTVGLDRALLELSRGSQARLILPSSLAYGVVGDGDRVAGRTVLVYKLEIAK